MIIAHPRETPDHGPGLFVGLVVFGATVGVLEETDAGGTQVEQFLANLIDDLERHVGRPGGEVRPRGPPAVRRVAEGPDKRSTILERELANEFSKMHKIKISTLIFVRLSVFFL